MPMLTANTILALFSLVLANQKTHMIINLVLDDPQLS